MDDPNLIVPAEAPVAPKPRKPREQPSPISIHNEQAAPIPALNGKDTWIKLIAGLAPQALIQVLLVGMVVWMGTIFLDKVNGLSATVADLAREVRELRMEMARTHK